MLREATAAGFADVVHSRIPRLQVVSIADWFEGKKPRLPPMEQIHSTAFETKSKGAKRPDPNAPELPLSFVGGKAAVRPEMLAQHLNPLTVSSLSRAKTA